MAHRYGQGHTVISGVVFGMFIMGLGLLIFWIVRKASWLTENRTMSSQICGGCLMVDKDSDVMGENDKYSSDLTFYRFIIDSIPSGVLSVNADLKITGFNP
jgi:hypothetical protein